MSDALSAADAFRKAVEALGVLYESPDAVAGNATREMTADQDAPDQTATPPLPTGEPASTAPDTPQRIGGHIGSYKIVEVLGRGGMGVVYLAEQEKPRREVALKVIRPGLTGQERLRRFEHEVQVLGRLQHPAVAQIYEAGMHDAGSGPQPYFAMELIQGSSLTSYARTRQLGTRARLELLAKVCDGVHHAHQKGVIHRDLKPGNILVDEAGQPKILDFGVARATDSDVQTTTLQTDIGQLIGTVPYMSPEQVVGDPDELDTRSDVYALGVVAYELLAERLPYDVANKMIHEAVRVIREDEPTPLSSVNRVFRGDVETIVAKALEKEKSRRYQSASDLASDIRRYLADEPVVARPPSAAYQMHKFARRNKALVGGVAAVFVVLVLGVIGTSIGLVRALAAEDLAQQRLVAERAAKQEASEAQAEAQQRADELEIVTEFQQSMLSEIDPERMGRGILADLRAGIREALEAGKASPEKIDEALASFDASLVGVNATNLALNVIDEEVLSRAVQTIEKEFADQPLVRAALQQTVADTYFEVGLYPPAMPLQEAALETRRAQLGNDHPQTLRSLNRMGLLLEEMGKLAEAEPYFREALEGFRRVLGDDHRGTLSCISNLGDLFRWMGKFTEAMSYYREALETRRRVLGDDHPETLNSICQMGCLFHAVGKPVKAEPYYREALEGNRRVLGDDHPDTLASISHMGSLLTAMGKYEKAESYYREALEGYRRVLGDDHPHTLISIDHMGSLLQSMGKLEEAEPYYREALEGKRRVLGNDHPDTLQSINNMGSLLDSMGKHAEVEPYYREALEGFRRVLGNDHPNTLGSIGNMGYLLHSMGKLTEAEPYYREALEGKRRVLGNDHPDTLESINNMGSLLVSMRKLAEAESYLREVMEGYRRNPVHGYAKPLISISNMASLLWLMDKLDEAEPLFADAVAGARRSLPEGHWNTGMFLRNHGSCLTKLKRYADAETALLEAHGILEAALGAEHKRTIGGVEALADLYTAWHAAEPDAGYDAQAAEWHAKLEQWQATTQPATSRPAATQPATTPAAP